MLRDNRSVWLPLPFARRGNALGARFQPDSGSPGIAGPGVWTTQPDHCDSRSNTRVNSLPGAPPPSPGQRADARPALALRPWRVTRRRRRRRGWPWPEARFRPLMARQVREPRTGRSWCCVPMGADRLRRPRPARSATGVLATAARARVRLGGRSGLRASRGRVHSRPSSHRCISSMSSTHWTMTRPGAGGSSSSRAPRRVLMSMHRLMAFSMVCGSMSSAPWWRR